MTEDLIQKLIFFASAIVFTALFVVFRLKKKALQIQERELGMQASDAELGPAVDALRNDVEQLADMQEHTQTQLTEMQERLDFTERMLAAGRASQDQQSK
jgi:hypothetical protein